MAVFNSILLALMRTLALDEIVIPVLLSLIEFPPLSSINLLNQTPRQAAL
jgi:hypothetical protein